MLAPKANDQLKMMCAMAFNSLGPKLKDSTVVVKSLKLGLNDSQRYIQGKRSCKENNNVEEKRKKKEGKDRKKQLSSSLVKE